MKMLPLLGRVQNFPIVLPVLNNSNNSNCGCLTVALLNTLPAGQNFNSKLFDLKSIMMTQSNVSLSASDSYITWSKPNGET